MYYAAVLKNAELYQTLDEILYTRYALSWQLIAIKSHEREGRRDFLCFSAVHGLCYTCIYICRFYQQSDVMTFRHNFRKFFYLTTNYPYHIFTSLSILKFLMCSVTQNFIYFNDTYCTSFIVIFKITFHVSSQVLLKVGRRLYNWNMLIIFLQLQINMLWFKINWVHCRRSKNTCIGTLLNWSKVINIPSDNWNF